MKAPPAPAFLACLFLLTTPIVAQEANLTVSRIRRVPVESSNVVSVGYSHSLHALEIEFSRGAVYRYLNVPASVYRQLLASASKGRFIAEHLRGKYDFVRVQPRRTSSRLTTNE